MGVLTIYGIVQNAAESTKRLQVMHPAYYQALYIRRLEMMYFLIESEFIRAGAIMNKWLSEYELAQVLAKLVGRA